MKYTIEVEDFYIGEDGDGLEDELRKYVTREVTKQIWEKIKEKVDKSITISVQAVVEKELALKINTRIADIIASENVTYDKKEMPITDYIKIKFQNNIGWNNPTEVIQQFAQKFGKEMKQRYDHFFATQIVSEMRTVGLLNEKTISALIENIKK